MKEPLVDTESVQLLPARRNRWGWLGLGLLLVLTFSGGFVLGRWTPEWPARARSPEVFSLLRIEPGHHNLFGSSPREDIDGEFGPFLQTQVQLITSPSVILATLANHHVTSIRSVHDQTDPGRWLRENLRVEIVPGSYLLKVSIRPRGMDPKEQALVINEIVKSYLDVANTWSVDKNRFQINNLEEYKRELVSKIEATQGAILALEEGISLRSDESQRAADRARIKFIETDLRDLEEMKKSVMRRIEQLHFDARGMARIKQIDPARAGSRTASRPLARIVSTSPLGAGAGGPE
jgi:hypothetical protein